MSIQYKLYVFQHDDRWETIDTCWTSPLSFWAQKSIRVEPPVPLRVTVAGVVVQRSDDGWINYGGRSAMLMQSVQALGRAGQRLRAEIHDDPVVEEEM